MEHGYRRTHQGGALIESRRTLYEGTPDFPQCGFSAQTVAALRACGAEFKHVNIFEDPELRED